MTRDDVLIYYESEMKSAQKNQRMAESVKDASQVKYFRKMAERAEWAYRALAIDYQRMINEIDKFQHSDKTSADQAAGAEKALDIMKKYVKDYVTIGD